MPHSRKKPGNSYHDRQTGRLFYLGPHNRYMIYFNDNFDVCREVLGIVHTIIVRLHRWAIVVDVHSASTFRPSQTSMASRSGRRVTPVPVTCATSEYILERKVCRQNSSKEPELYVIWLLRFTVPAVTLPLTISSRLPLHLRDFELSLFEFRRLLKKHWFG